MFVPPEARGASAHSATKSRAGTVSHGLFSMAVARAHVKAAEHRLHKFGGPLPDEILIAQCRWTKPLVGAATG